MTSLFARSEPGRRFASVLFFLIVLFSPFASLYALNVSGTAVNTSTWIDSFPAPPGDNNGNGDIRVGAWAATGDLEGAPLFGTVISSGALPLAGGNYTIGSLSNDTTYRIMGWVDGDSDGNYELGEPRSDAENVSLSSDDVGNLTLTILDDYDDDDMDDWWEAHWFPDLGEFPSGDYDNDGLSNEEEYYISRNFPDLLFINAGHFDTDSDRMDDYWEYSHYVTNSGVNATTNDAFGDADGDGLQNIKEYLGPDGQVRLEQDPMEATGVARVNPNDSGDAMNPADIDTDHDYLIDSFEAAWYDPANNIDPSVSNELVHLEDLDNDGLSNFREQCLLATLGEGDSNDIWSEGIEASPLHDIASDAILRRFTTPLTLGATNLSHMESDKDALRAHAWTDPTHGSGYFSDDVYANDGWDTDGDLLPDGWEVEFNLDPRDATGANGFLGDPDGDTLVNYEEYTGQDGYRSSTKPYINGTGDESNPNTHNFRPNSTGSGPGAGRPEIETTYWANNSDSPTNGTLGAALPTISIGTDPGLDSDEDGLNDQYEIQQEFVGGYIGSSPVHSMHPFIKRCGVITNAAGIEIHDPETYPGGGYRPLIHTRNWTLECHVKLMQTNMNGYILNCYGYDSNNISWRLELSNNVPILKSETLGGFQYNVSGPSIPTNKWVHIAGMFDTDENSMAIYIDGVFVQEQRIYQELLSGYNFACFAPPTIGTSEDGSFVNKLYIDEIRIWEIARTAEDIEEYRNKLVVPTHSNLVAYYRFDDGGVMAEDFARRAKSGLIGADTDEYIFGDHGYALSNGFDWVTNDYANIRGVSKRGADDTDGDGMSDAWEMINSLDWSSTNNVEDGAYGDPDGDGLVNIYEFWSETNPREEDTDQNGVLDGSEDFDGDGVSNLTEQDLGSRPDMVDTDDDGLTDNEERYDDRDPADPAVPWVSRSMSFGGAVSDYVEIPVNFNQRLRQWTLEAWIKVTNATAAQGSIVSRVAQNMGTGTNTVCFSLGLTTNASGLVLYTGYVQESGEISMLYGKQITTGQWFHVAGVSDNNNRKLILYTNGVESATVNDLDYTPPINGKGGDTYVRIGQDFSGLIDEVRIWDNVRSQSSISSYMEEVLATNEMSDLVHYFRFDDSQANTNEESFGTYHSPKGAHDFVYPEDWHEEWAHAASLNGNVAFCDDGAIPDPPSLQVYLAPATAVSNGAQWAIDSGEWRNSGAIVYNLTEGSHTISFKEITGWTEPSDLSVTLEDGPTKVLTNTYVSTSASTNGSSATDSDSDGLTDVDELNTYSTDPNDLDSDDDGLSDYEEVITYSTDPNDADSDNDGLSDGSEVDIYSTDPNDSDSDDDGLSDGDEVNTYGTDPNDSDSDDDGINDGTEVANGTDPGSVAGGGMLAVLNDYNGDRISDLAVRDAQSGSAYIASVAGNSIAWSVQWGWEGDDIVPGDYNGDKSVDMGSYADGLWYIDTVGEELIAWATQWGWEGATPVPGDYNGDGKSDLAVMGNGQWYIYTLTGNLLAWGVQWGWAGATPVTGDYDGDGISDLAVLDETSGQWFIRTFGTENVLAWGVQWGWSGATPVPGDYDGDKIYDLAVMDQATGSWYVYSLANGVIAWNDQWGWNGAVPVAGDFNGDGKSDQAVFDNTTGNWYIKTMDNRILAWDLNWGWPGAVPITY